MQTETAKFCVAALCLTVSLIAQEVPDAVVVHPNQRVAVPNLPMVTAADATHAAVLKTAVAIVLSGSNITCDPDAALESRTDATSLRTLASKLSGASCAIQGQVRQLAATFVPNAEIKADDIIAAVQKGKPLLIEWKRAPYVLYGVVYDEYRHADGHRINTIRELLLIDPRYSDHRRLVSFRRDKDNFADVEGVATLSIAH